jgi:O-methyltransferase
MSASAPDLTRLVTTHHLDESQRLYLDLLKKTLTRFNSGGHEYLAFRPRRSKALAFAWRGIESLLRVKNLSVMRVRPFDAHQRRLGLDWPAEAETMVGLLRLENIQDAVVDVVKSGIPGDLVETGVWRGGTSIFMRGILRALGDNARRVWVCDSFEGLPAPDAKKYPADAGDKHSTVSELAVSEKQVRANFERYGLLDENVRFVVGWFRDTLPRVEIKQIAVLRLDGDMYESTHDALVNLYDKVSFGGYIAIDDYGQIEGCRKAVLDFRRDRGICEPLVDIDGTGVYWRRRA